MKNRSISTWISPGFSRIFPLKTTTDQALPELGQFPTTTTPDQVARVAGGSSVLKPWDFGCPIFPPQPVSWESTWNLLFNILDSSHQMGVSENRLNPYTQWLMIRQSLLNGYFIGNIPYFQTNPNQFKSHFLPAMIFGRISDTFWGLEDMRHAVSRFDSFISEQANNEAFAFESMIFPSMVQMILRQSGFVSRLRWPVGVNGKHSSALFNSDSPRESHFNCLGPPVFPQSSDNPVWVRFFWLCIHSSCWMSIGKIPASLANICSSKTAWLIFILSFAHRGFVSNWGTENSNRWSRFFFH